MSNLKRNEAHTYSVYMNGTLHAYFTSRRYAETYVRAQRGKATGGGGSWAAAQRWEIQKLED